MNGRIIRQDGGRYIVFDDLPRVRIEGDVDDDVIAQIGGKLIKRAKKKAIKRLKKKSLKKKPTKKKTLKKKRTVRKKGTTTNAAPPSAFGSSVIDPKNPLSALLMQQSLNKYQQPLFDPKKAIEGPKDDKEKEDMKKMIDELKKRNEELNKKKLITSSSSSNSKPSSSSSSSKGKEKAGDFEFDEEELKDASLMARRIESLKKELGDLYTERSSLEDERNEVRTELFNIQAAVRNTEHIKERLEHEIEKQNEAQEALRDDLKELEDELIDSEEKLEKAKDERQKLIRESAKRKFQTEAEKLKYAKKTKKRIDVLNDYIKGMVGDIKSLSKKADEKEKQLEEKEKKVEEQENKLKEMETNINDLKEIEGILQVENEQLQTKNKIMEKAGQIDAMIRDAVDYVQSKKGADETKRIKDVIASIANIVRKGGYAVGDFSGKGKQFEYLKKNKDIGYIFGKWIKEGEKELTEEKITEYKEEYDKNKKDDGGDEPEGLEQEDMDNLVNKLKSFKTNAERRKYLDDIGYGYLLGEPDEFEDAHPYEMTEEEKEKFKGLEKKFKGKYKQLTNPDHQRYFIKTISNPQWVDWLWNKAFKDRTINESKIFIDREIKKEAAAEKKRKEDEEEKKRVSDLRDKYGIPTFKELSGMSNEEAEKKKKDLEKASKVAEDEIENRLKSKDSSKNFKNLKEFNAARSFFEDFAQFELEENKMDAKRKRDFIKGMIAKHGITFNTEEAAQKFKELKPVFTNIPKDIEEVISNKRYIETTIQNIDKKLSGKVAKDVSAEQKGPSFVDQLKGGIKLKKTEVKPKEKPKQDDQQVLNKNLFEKMKKMNQDEEEQFDDEEWQEVKNPPEEAPKEGETSGEQPGEGKGKGGLFNTEINDMMKKYTPKGFKGVYAVDQLNLIPLKRSDKIAAFVMNTEPITTPSGHWVSIVLTPTNLEYYDSFGEEPSKAFLKNMKRLANAWAPDSLLQFKINRIKFQRANSDNCGYFAMKFIKDRLDGKNFKQATGFEIVSRAIKGEKDIEKFKKRVKEFGSI